MRAKLAHGRTSAASSTPSLQEGRQRALTTTPADLSTGPGRSRSASITSKVSSQVSVSPVVAPVHGVQTPPKLGVITNTAGNTHAGSAIGHVRVKSKVSQVVEQSIHIPRSAPTSPSFPPSNRPARVPSISNLSLSPPLSHAPPPRTTIINNSNYTSLHQRYSTTGQLHSPKERQARSATPHDDSVVSYTSQSHPAKVDPTSIPLPPLSPPTSTLSFSSRSSTSKSSSGETRHSEFSGSTAPTLHSRLNGNDHSDVGRHSRSSSTADGLGIQVAPSLILRELSKDGVSFAGGSDDGHDSHDDADHIDSERKRRNEAKSNRKVNRCPVPVNS